MNGDARETMRKGWCPGALRPMAARDGLLVRLRLTGGVLPAATARELAGLAERHGNGLLDLSARANLQLRGVGEDGWPALLDGLRRLGLLDADAAGEAVRNVMASPLAGLGERVDIRPLVAELEASLAGNASLHALPAKFGFLIDDGGAPTLARIAADVRFDWRDGRFAVGLGGTAANGRPAGWCRADALVERASGLARAVVALQVPKRPRRLRALLRELSPQRQAEIFGASPRPDLPDASDDAVIGLQSFDGIATLGLGVAFGRLDASMLRTAAAVADHAGCGELRLTPWRAILIPRVEALRVDLGALADAGFIVTGEDPRSMVAACVGAAGCARGTTPTQRDAAELAGLLAPTPDALNPDAVRLHVSGCAKGCAKPSPTALTLVGRDGRYDLVRDGRPGDEPERRGLELTEVRALLAPEKLPA